MEHASYILVFITLLQLCRAEQSETGWFSANVINDGDYSPKPISEIFSSEPPPFSSTNPIVVLSKSTTPSTPISTSVTPRSSSSFSTGSESLGYMSTYSTIPSTIYTQNGPTSSLSTQQPFSQPTSEQTRPTFNMDQSTYPNTKPAFDLGQTPYSKPSFDLGQSTYPGFKQPYDLEHSIFQDAKPTFDLAQPFPFNQPSDKPTPSGPNYFLIYQQAQNLPPSAPQQTFSTFQPSGPSSTLVPSSTLRPELPTPQSTFSTFNPQVTSGPPLTSSTFQPEISTISSTFSTLRPEVSSTPISTVGFTPSSVSTLPSQSTSSQITTVSDSRTTNTNPPCNTTSPLSRYPALRIRMVAPSGSITNIHINPATTTNKPITKRTTTTRKPTTRRTKKSRNTYNGCMNICDNKGKNPICAAPLAQMPIDADKLKGFPSVCHMACHNSFRKDQYEMLTEGRCGKLRTRIRTMDSDKLKRVELNKAQYSIVDPQTILEFSALPRK